MVSLCNSRLTLLKRSCQIACVVQHPAACGTSTTTCCINHSSSSTHCVHSVTPYLLQADRTVQLQAGFWYNISNMTDWLASFLDYPACTLSCHNLDTEGQLPTQLGMHGPNAAAHVYAGATRGARHIGQSWGVTVCLLPVQS